MKPYREANHPPIVALQGPQDVQAAPGATVALNVSGSVDPDGDILRYSWWQYRDAGTYKGQVMIADADRARASIHIPSEAKVGETIHLVGEVTDTGKPPLTRYRRVIVTVSGR